MTLEHERLNRENNPDDFINIIWGLGYQVALWEMQDFVFLDLQSVASQDKINRVQFYSNQLSFVAEQNLNLTIAVADQGSRNFHWHTGDGPQPLFFIYVKNIQASSLLNCHYKAHLL